MQNTAGVPTAAVPDDHGSGAGASVVVCAHTERRWEQTQAALRSALSQRPAPAQVLLVVDHNPALAQRARRALPEVTVLESDGPQGLSGARNTGLRAATGQVTAFLDDDAEARPGWLAALVEPFGRADVVGTGGGVHPRWPRARPGWLPPTFDWVVGCSYAGLPDTVAPVRNPIGANMALRTRLTLQVGAFDTAVGRIGSRPRGCEETELAIRLTARRPGGVVLYVPDAVVDHHVAPERLRARYFLSRCWHEGRSKADVVRLAGAQAGLERERRQILTVIPKAVAGELRSLARGDLAAPGRMAATCAGLAATVLGYLTGRARLVIRARLARAPRAAAVQES